MRNMAFWSNILLFSSLIVFVAATEVEQCPGNERAIDTKDVTLTKCSEPPCILKRRTRVGIKQRLRPDHDVKELTTSVSAKIADIPFPFVGVDGTSACDNIYSEDGKTKVGCPLKAGETYIYKNAFDVLPFYPTVNLIVHWALTEPDKKDLTCFEVQARIK